MSWLKVQGRAYGICPRAVHPLMVTLDTSADSAYASAGIGGEVIGSGLEHVFIDHGGEAFVFVRVGDV